LPPSLKKFPFIATTIHRVETVRRVKRCCSFASALFGSVDKHWQPLSLPSYEVKRHLVEVALHTKQRREMVS